VVAVKLSAIIPHYYPTRETNLPRIVQALLAGSVKPDEILIWCNSPLQSMRNVVQMLDEDRVLLIDSPRNVGAQARFLAALMARGDYVFFQDNDLCVRDGTLENLLRNAAPGSVVSLDGYFVPPIGYLHRKRVFGKSVNERVLVNVTLGRAELVDRETLRTALRDFPFDDATIMDDLAFSACCHRVKVELVVVPARPGVKDFKELPTCGVGISLGPRAAKEQYMQLRDRTFKRLFREARA
jgi:hypothetical protein